MTHVRLGLAQPTAVGAIRRQAGTMEWRPNVRRTVGPDVVLPAPFTVGLGSEPPPVIDVAPTSSSWVWRVVEKVPGGSARARYLAVPDSDDVIGYGDLVEVDPATLDPAAEPEAAWWVALAAAATGQALIGVDSDGVPYYDPAGVDQPVVLGVDSDGVTYFVPPASVTTDDDGVPVITTPGGPA